MAQDDNSKLELRSRLEQMRDGLQIRPSPDNPRFEQAVVDACRSRVDGMLAGVNAEVKFASWWSITSTMTTGVPICSGEAVHCHVAESLQVCCEEGHEDQDILELEQKYLREKAKSDSGN